MKYCFEDNGDWTINCDYNGYVINCLNGIELLMSEEHISVYKYGIVSMIMQWKYSNIIVS